MIYETGIETWPYKIRFDSKGDNILMQSKFYEPGTNGIVHFNEEFNESTKIRWIDYDKNYQPDWWFYFRNEEDAIKALTLIGGI